MMLLSLHGSLSGGSSTSSRDCSVPIVTSCLMWYRGRISKRRSAGERVFACTCGLGKGVISDRNTTKAAVSFTVTCDKDVTDEFIASFILKRWITHSCRDRCSHLSIGFGALQKAPPLPSKQFLPINVTIPNPFQTTFKDIIFDQNLSSLHNLEKNNTLQLSKFQLPCRQAIAGLALALAGSRLQIQRLGNHGRTSVAHATAQGNDGNELKKPARS